MNPISSKDFKFNVKKNRRLLCLKSKCKYLRTKDKTEAEKGASSWQGYLKHKGQAKKTISFLKKSKNREKNE
jgi:hypothetical protein